MRPALWTFCALCLLSASCGKGSDSNGDSDAECSTQTDCAKDQSKSCAAGTCVDVGTAPSMEIRLSKGSNVRTRTLQSLRLVSVQTVTPSGKTAHCPTLGGQEVSSVSTATDPAKFNHIFEKSFSLASGDVYQTGAPMNDDTGVIFAEVFDVPMTQQNEAGTKPVGTGCWDRSRDQFFDCPNGNKCITFELN